MDFLGFLIGGFVASAFFIIAIVAVWLFNMMHNAKYNRIIKITNKTGGKDVVEWWKGCLMKHKVLGDVYYVPALKKEDRHYIPFTGKSDEYPTNKPRQQFVPLTFLDGTYAPEKHQHTEEVEIDVIEKRYGDLSEEEYLKIPLSEREKNKTLYKVSFHRIKKKVTSYIIKPTKYSMRQFNLMMDTSIKDDFFLNPGFWDKYGGLVVAFGLVLMASVVSIVMIVFAYQWGVDISQNIPEWMQTFLQSFAANSGAAAPPTMG